MPKTFQIFENSQPSNSLLEIAQDKSVLRFKTFSAYLAHNKLNCNVEDFHKLKLFIFNQIQNQIESYACTYYLNCMSKNNWGEAGENATKISLCRLLINIPHDKLIQSNDLIRFEKTLSDKIEKYHLNQISDYTHTLKNFEIKLLNCSFKPGHVDQIQQLLNFFETQLIYYAGIEQSIYSILLGKGQKSFIEEHTVYDINIEIARSPNLTTTMAAIILDRSIYIRNLTIQTIYHQKWELTHSNATQNFKNEWEEIAEAIKQKTLSLYKDENDNYKSNFIADMRENILKHEIGHGIVQHEVLPMEAASSGEATKYFGETIYSSILEFLADFCPENPKGFGPIFNMIKISKTDYKRAQKMFWMYLSDVWFYNTPDTFMYDYSDMMCLILLHFIERDGHIRFDKLEKTIFFNPHSAEKQPKGIFEHLYSLYLKDCGHLVGLIKSADYTINGEPHSYEQLKSFLNSYLKKNNPHLSEFSYSFQTLYWYNMFGYIQKFSNKKKQMNAYIQNQSIVFMNYLLKFIAGTSNAEKIGYNRRHFILQSAYQCGLLTEAPKIS